MIEKHNFQKFQVTSYDKEVKGEIRVTDNRFVLIISCEGKERAFDLLAQNEENEKQVVWYAEKVFYLYASKAALGEIWETEEKPGVRLFHWYIDKAESKGRTWWYASGITLGHPKLLDSQQMRHSSEIMNICIDEDQEEVRIETWNTIFHCPLIECEYAKVSTYEYLPELKKYREKYESCQNQFDMEDNSVLLAFSDHDYYYFRYGAILQEGKKRELTMTSHIGMFQDSVLIYPDGREICELPDIRYFPHPGYIEFYKLNIPDGCRLYVENQGDGDFYIDWDGDLRIKLLPNERKLYDKVNAVPKENTPQFMRSDLYPTGIILPEDDITDKKDV